jgi:D-ribitol-5-phosphate cytidylyltransferase
MNYAGILAGGKGSRMGVTERPKQFLHMGDDGTPIIVHTLRAFLNCDDIDGIVIACPQAWLEYTKVLVAENCTPKEQGRIYVIAGGKERFDSLANICSFIEGNFGLTDNDILVSHDAVRPFVTQRILEENIEMAAKYGCVDTVVPSTDTIVVSYEGRQIDDISPRSQFYQGQTPQSFRITEYRAAFDALTEEQKATLTDACKVYLLNDKPVHLVMGEYCNIKITTPHDLNVGESILAAARQQKGQSQES